MPNFIPSDAATWWRDSTPGSVEELERIFAGIQERWPKAWVVVRGDSGFCREDIMDWCERRGV